MHAVLDRGFRDRVVSICTRIVNLLDGDEFEVDALTIGSEDDDRVAGRELCDRLLV